MFIELSTHEYPVSRDQIAERVYPTAIPGELNAAQAAEHGYAPVELTPPPDAEDGFQLVEAKPAWINGAWRQQWDTVAFEPPPIPVPQAVPALNGLLALDAAGLAPAFEAWANAPERTFAERAFLQHAQTWRRDNPVLIAGATALGVTENELDNLFRAAVDFIV